MQVSWEHVSFFWIGDGHNVCSQSEWKSVGKQPIGIRYGNSFQCDISWQYCPWQNRRRAEHFLWFSVPSPWFQLWTCLALAEDIAGFESLENLVWEQGCPDKLSRGSEGAEMGGAARGTGFKIQCFEYHFWAISSTSCQDHCDFQTQQMQKAKIQILGMFQEPLGILG